MRGGAPQTEQEIEIGEVARGHEALVLAAPQLTQRAPSISAITLASRSLKVDPE